MTPPSPVALRHVDPNVNSVMTFHFFFITYMFKEGSPSIQYCLVLHPAGLGLAALLQLGGGRGLRGSGRAGGGGAVRLQRALRGMAAPLAHAWLESRTAARFATAWRLRAGPKAGTGRGEAAVLAAAGPARI